MWFMSDYERCAFNMRNRELLFNKIYREKQLKRQQDIIIDRVLESRASIFTNSNDDIELNRLNINRGIK